MMIQVNLIDHIGIPDVSALQSHKDVMEVGVPDIPSRKPHDIKWSWTEYNLKKPFSRHNLVSLDGV